MSSALGGPRILVGALTILPEHEARAFGPRQHPFAAIDASKVRATAEDRQLN